MVGVDEVDMVGKPADTKGHNHKSEHLDNFLFVLSRPKALICIHPLHTLLREKLPSKRKITYSGPLRLLNLRVELKQIIKNIKGLK